jgi:hypothetical protein
MAPISSYTLISSIPLLNYQVLVILVICIGIVVIVIALMALGLWLPKSGSGQVFGPFGPNLNLTSIQVRFRFELETTHPLRHERYLT